MKTLREWVQINENSKNGDLPEINLAIKTIDRSKKVNRNDFNMIVNGIIKWGTNKKLIKYYSDDDGQRGVYNAPITLLFEIGILLTPTAAELLTKSVENSQGEKHFDINKKNEVTVWVN